MTIGNSRYKAFPYKRHKQYSSLRAQRSNPELCNIDQDWIASSLTLLAMTPGQRPGVETG
jgi:hypothetical protein